METLFLYFGKVILCSGVTFLYYQLSLKDKTFHHYNRFYLLSAILLSLLLPLIKVDDFTIEVNNEVYLLINKVQNFNSDKNISNDHIYFRIIFSALGLVSLYFIGRFIYGIIKIQQLKNQFHKESFDGINFYHTNLTEAPFSYFKNLFWKNSIVLNSDIGKQILKHEMVHIEQKHSFDKIFIEVVTSVFWFNPFFYLIKKELTLIHEYLADKKAVKQSDTKAFAQMLLASHFSGTQLPATSPFLSSNLKKRLKMLQKPKTKFGYARRIFALPVLFTVAFAYMVNAKNKEIKESNIAIHEAVAQIKEEPQVKKVTEIKKDTITPGRLSKIDEPQQKILRKRETEKLKDLGKKIQEKSLALKELKPESKEFQKNVDELSTLSAEMGKITSSDDFRMAYMINASEVKKINDFFKSDEWKNKVKDLKNNMDIEIPEIPEINFDFSEVPSPPSPPNAPRVKVMKFKDIKDMKWDAAELTKASENAKGAMEYAAKRAKIDRKRAKLNEKRAKLDVERAKLEAERRALDGNNRRAYIFNSSTSFSDLKEPAMLMHADFVKKDGNGNITMNGVKNFKFNGNDDAKIFIDGKQVTKKEMEALNPANIKSMNINKRSKDGDSSSEIRIETKK
ncbi:M56 family metallopeptidase [Chryseobacterium paludis]|uniref:M56 family metallopeptidase n=1 Tax=Chryseobacterium paludis TaxID=2956784 RepID=UPI0021C06929|nr:M56 family metallopeptidase [Chryseobacterium paludis]